MVEIIFIIADATDKETNQCPCLTPSQTTASISSSSSDGLVNMCSGGEGHKEEHKRLPLTPKIVYASENGDGDMFLIR